SAADSIRPPLLTGFGNEESIDVRIWGRMPNPCMGEVPASLDLSAEPQDFGGCAVRGESNALGQCATVRITLPTPGDETYRGVSFPLLGGAPGSDLLSTIRTALGQQQNHEHWRIFGWDGSRYREVDADNEANRLKRIEPGKGYWLITDERDETLDISGEPVGLDSIFTLTLDAPDTAWFQISLPFLQPDSVGGIYVDAPGYSAEPIAAGTLVEGKVQEWEPQTGKEGVFNPRCVLLPGHAYWIKKLLPGPVRIHFSPPSLIGPTPSLACPEPVPSGAEWAIRVQASRGDRQSTPIWMGALTEDEEWRERLNLSLAPTPPEGFGLVLFMPTLDAGVARNRIWDFRPSAEAMSWNIEARQRTPGPIELTLLQSNIPEDVSVILDDLDSGSEYAIPSKATVVLSADRLVHQMRIRVGSRTVIPPNPPAASVIHTASPNPFHGGTSLRMTVNERAEVLVRIYDLLGRRITALFQGWAEPGLLITEWDGNDAAGNRAAAGIYFFEAQIGEHHLTQRIVKLRD
ncbi:MAG TPA: FlgD immunoglobulin-like domain containing protein, partial [Candidatus Eisenbacteria bacterium]|nr:FlgD immunoglobulin-like domain containing protein [Candidatus Eisenbacteria bacterium]